MMIIQRREAGELVKMPGWVLLYGRRKVGKTFLLKNYGRWDAYFSVRRDLAITAEGAPPVSGLDSFCEEVKRLLREGKTVIIDEFQRLPESFLEEVASVHPHGRLILAGSSFRIVRSLFHPRSPLLGLVGEKRLGLISPHDCLRSLSKYFPPLEALLLAPYVRDPWVVSHLGKGEPVRAVFGVLSASKHTIPALIGEVFGEEERQLTRIYEVVLRLIGAGKWRIPEISSTLYGRGLLDSADPRAVTAHIKNMEEMDLVEAIEIHKARSRYLRLKSPIMEAFYHLSDRYDFEEREVEFREVEPTLRRLMAAHVQDFVAQLLAEREGGERAYYFAPDQEIDFLVKVRGKPRMVGEVKLGKVSEREIKRFLEVSSSFPGAERVFVGLKRVEGRDIVSLTPSDLLRLARKGPEP